MLALLGSCSTREYCDFTVKAVAQPVPLPLEVIARWQIQPEALPHGRGSVFDFADF